MQDSPVQGLQRHLGSALIYVLDKAVSCAYSRELVLDDLYLSYRPQGPEDFLRRAHHVNTLELGRGTADVQPGR
jgi:hypothetical protein